MLKVTLTKSVTRLYALGKFENYKVEYAITKDFDADKFEEKDYQIEFNGLSAILQGELIKEKEKLQRRTNATKITE